MGLRMSHCLHYNISCFWILSHIKSPSIVRLKTQTLRDERCVSKQRLWIYSKILVYIYGLAEPQSDSHELLNKKRQRSSNEVREKNKQLNNHT